MHPQSRLFLYLLEMTDAGSDRAPSHECACAHVVRAPSAQDARAEASEAAIDEGPGTWLSPELSTCKRIGEVGPGAPRTVGVVCTADNAS